MIDERLGRTAGAWLRDTDEPAPDPQGIVWAAMAHVQQVRQVHASGFRARFERETVPVPGVLPPATDHHVRTGGSSMSAALRFVMAAVVLLVSGGLLFAVVWPPSTDEAVAPVPATSAASPQPTASSGSPALTITDTTSDGEFELTISSPKSTWTVDEPIDISAMFTYVGDSSPSTVYATGAGPVGFWFEQLDGSLTNVDRLVGDTSCGSFTYVRGKPEVLPFQKSGRYDPDSEDPDEVFWRTWLDDPELHLPVGTYRIAASASYGASVCDEHQLTTAIEITVVGTADPTPEASDVSDASSRWGPLSVVTDRPLDGSFDLAGLGPGTITIGDKCVTFKADRAEVPVTLIWTDTTVAWRPNDRRIVFTDRQGDVVRVDDGDRLMLKGDMAWSPESHPRTAQAQPGQRWSLWLDGRWLTEPDPSCPGNLWYVAEVDTDGIALSPTPSEGSASPSSRSWTSEGIKATSDLRAIAESSGWTIDQAKAQEAANRAIDDIIGTVFEEQPDIYIGGALAEEPGGAPSLYIKGPAPQWVLDLVAAADGPITVVDEQPYSFDELEARKDRAHQALVDAGYANVATGVNITGGGIIPVSLLTVAGLPSDPEAILAFVPADLRADVQLDVAIAPPRPSAEPDAWGPLAVVYQPAGFGPGVGLGPVTLRIGEACVWIESKQGRNRTTLVFEGDHVDWRPAKRRIVFTDRRGEKVRLSDGDRIEGGGVSLWPPQGPEGESRPNPTPEPGRRWGAWLDEAWLQEPDTSCREALFFLSEVSVRKRSR